MSRIVENPLGRFDHARTPTNLFPGVQIATKARKVTAGNVKTDPVILLEDVASYREINCVMKDFSRNKQFRLRC